MTIVVVWLNGETTRHTFTDPTAKLVPHHFGLLVEAKDPVTGWPVHVAGFYNLRAWAVTVQDTA